MERTQMLGLPIYAPEDIFDLTEVNKAHKNIEIAYQAMENIQSTNASAEVIGARKGEPNLKAKIDKIDDAIDNIESQLDDITQEAVQATGNKVVNISKGDWVYNPTNKMYEYTINHTMNSKDLIIDCYNLATGDFVLCGGKIVNNNSVLIKSEANIGLKVVLNARYYKATLTISDDIAREVVEARKTHETVGKRLDNVDLQLDEITTNVEKVNNDFYNAKVIDLKNEEDFNINNISTCVNRIFSNIEKYTTVKLNIGTCYLTQPINITMKEGCELLLNCKIICKKDINAININGNRVSNNIYIKSLISLNKQNFNNILGNGLTLDNYYNSSIKIGEILGFNTGLLLKGTSGSQYNKIDFFSISNCKECIVLNPLSASHWVNENTFTGGRVGGNVGIHLKGISNTDIINNNKFYNVGFEGIKTLLIKAVGARYNSLCNPRVLEDYPTTRWIEEDGSCIGNKYNFTFPVKASLFKLDYLSEINASLTTDNGKTITQLGAVCDWDITSETMKLQYKYFLNGILMTDNDFHNDGGTITLNECFKEVYCKLSTSARKLRIAKHLLYNGFTFNLYITAATTGKLQLEYYNKQDKLITGTYFFTNGVYRITMYNDLLVYTKIGDEFKMV